jgi:hypothetical protein
MSGMEYWYNFVWCSKIIWRDDVFRRVFLPCAKLAGPSDERIAELAESQEAARLRDEFQTTKRHTDEEALAWLEIK